MSGLGWLIPVFWSESEILWMRIVKIVWHVSRSIICVFTGAVRGCCWAAVCFYFAIIFLWPPTPQKKKPISVILWHYIKISLLPSTRVLTFPSALAVCANYFARNTEISFEEFPFVFFCYQVCTSKCLQDERLLWHYNAIKCVTWIASTKIWFYTIVHLCSSLLQGRRVTHLSTPMAVRVKTDTYTVTGWMRYTR